MHVTIDLNFEQCVLGNAGCLPQLVPDQVRKLKQLSVLTLAETNKVQFAAGRDLRPGKLGSMIQTLTNWLSTSDNLLLSIQVKIKCADTMTELAKKNRKEVECRVEEAKKSLSFKADIAFQGNEEGIYSELGVVMDYEEDQNRSKR
ncbi:hypothetical protein HHK36_028065 [Tetracentron sinense]|uniref:Uncharacterized protein n=1 Tax=Tetracentron sinense TaxID=13715 RepID=A0A835D1S8_TETSI|nr:hypothetical protein HHK36_028065 [Tetracentron sinense]